MMYCIIMIKQIIVKMYKCWQPKLNCFTVSKYLSCSQMVPVMYCCIQLGSPLYSEAAAVDAPPQNQRESFWYYQTFLLQCWKVSIVLQIAP